jgi:predicted ATP-dependent endonuclease of OLD family
MKIIESIRIKYFRSILNTTRGNQTHIKANDLNLIIGSNDAGKSNYLRALNLFFNNQSESNTTFSFWKDYSIQRHGVRRK